MAGNKGRVGLIPQDRDRRLLSEVAVLRDIDREMATIIAPFGSPTRAKLRLLELTRAGFLLQYVVGTIHGGRKAIYRLSAKGAALLGLAAGSAERKTRNHSSAGFTSTARTRNRPSLRRSATRCPPMKPPAPVTTTSVIVVPPFVRVNLSPSASHRSADRGSLRIGRRWRRRGNCLQRTPVPASPVARGLRDPLEVVLPSRAIRPHRLARRELLRRFGE